MVDSELIDELAEFVETLKDVPFEPFSELAIWSRQKTPGLLMVLAAFAFDSDAMDEAYRTFARAELCTRLAYWVYLAEIGMAATDRDYKLEPHGTTVRYLLTRMKRAFGEGGSQKDLEKIRCDLECLLPLVEAGLAIPTSDVAQ